MDFDATRDSENWHGWTSNGAKWGFTNTVTYKKLILNKGFIVSPLFNIPDDTKVSVYLECQFYKITSGSSTFTIGASSTTNSNATANKVSSSVSRQIYTDRTGDRNFTVSTKLQSNAPHLCITATETNSIVFYVKMSYE